ncbi:hypothetical protein ACSS6W_003803 [Trichoderma asperelloides]
MAAIYSSATNVAIYLGEASEGSEQAIDFITECDTPSSDTNSLSYIKSACQFVVSGPKISSIEREELLPMFKLLVQARHCEATDPRDKIYSMLSLLGTSDKQFSLKPRYEDPVAMVYTDCALALLADSGCDLLSAGQGGSTIDGLPSWVPDWSVQPRREILGTSMRVARNRPYDFEERAVNPKSPQVILDESTPGTMKETGIVPLDFRGDDSNEYIFHKVIGAAGFGYKYAISRFVQKEAKVEQAPEGDVYALSWESSVRQVASERHSAQATDDFALPFTDIPFHLAAKEQPPSYQAYVQFVLKNCHSRRFFITDTGYMGIGPEGAKIDDNIYICVGAAIPFAFREVDKNCNWQSPKVFQLVGECYTDEKVWRDLDGRISSPQYFDLI